MSLERMEQDASPPYQFKMLGSVYIYPSQTGFYRQMAAAFAVGVAGLILIGLNVDLGWFYVLAGNVVGLYVLETGYRRGRALS